MRSLLRAIGVAAVVSACGGGPGGACDLAALRAAADATDEMMRVWDPRSGVLPDYGLAVRGMQGACPGLPRGFAAFFEQTVQPQPERDPGEFASDNLLRDAEALRPLRVHCTDFQKIVDSIDSLPGAARQPAMYDGCHFAELGLVARDDISETTADLQTWRVHALYLWLVDAGAPAEMARALARPILASTDQLLAVTRDIRLPAAPQGPSPPRDAATLLVTSYMVTVDHQQLALLTDGALADADRRRGFDGSFPLSRKYLLGEQPPPGEEPEKPGSLVVAADVRVRWATLGPFVEAAWRAGYAEILVDALAPTPLQPLVVVPLVTRGAAPTGVLAVSPTGLRLRCGGGDGAPAVDALPTELARCGGTLSLAVSADTALPRVVEVLVALSGQAAVVDFAAP